MNSNKEIMIKEQLINRGIHDRNVIDAFKEVPREAFLADDAKQYAYLDSPLAIGNSQTISQPYIVAYMSEALDLQATDKVLEIGTGSGYQTAILAEIVDEVYTIERIKELSEKAQRVLQSLNYDSIHFIIGDGTMGDKENAPYDKIIVTAAAKEVPKALLNQLDKSGKLIMPVGNQYVQELVLYEKCDDKIQKSNLGGCRFVPFITDEQ